MTRQTSKQVPIYPRVLKFYFPLLATLLLTTPTQAENSTQPKQTKNWLFALHKDETAPRLVGVMVNDVTCYQISEALNTWAKAPPVTPITFFCEPEPAKA